MEMTKELNWYCVCDVADIPVQEGRRVYFEDKKVALYNLGYCFRAIDAVCPHKQGPLEDGIVSGDSVTCPLHNWNVSLKDGCVQSGGEGRVLYYPVKVKEGRVYIAFDAGE